MKIWIDADACPKDVKEVVFKAAERTQVNCCMVANSYMRPIKNKYVSFVQVDKGADVADFYIVEHSEKEDIVITADIPLASLIVDKGAIAINPRGELYTVENIKERLSVRDFMQGLRDSGVETGGPASYGTREKQNFANTFNKILTSKLK